MLPMEISRKLQEQLGWNKSFVSDEVIRVIWAKCRTSWRL